MSIWGAKFNENDDAADWLSDFVENPKLTKLEKTFSQIEPSANTYIDVNNGSEVLAAGEVLAQLTGLSSKVIDDDIESLLYRQLQKKTPADIGKLIQNALISIDKVSTDQEKSELLQLISEDKEMLNKWKENVMNLKVHLEKIDPKQPLEHRGKKVPVKSKRIKYKIGDIVSIPLPDGKYAFAKIYKNSDLGVYDLISDKVEDVSVVLSHKVAFINAVTDSPVKSGDWPIIGHEPFPDEESSWGPPMATGIFPGMEIDSLSIKIEHKGAYKMAAPAEVKGLQISSFSWKPELFVHQIIKRIIEKKEAEYRVQ